MTYKLSVRWKARAESVSACAAGVARTLSDLAAIHPNLADWRQQARTLLAADRPFCTMPPSLSELESILSRGRHFTGASKELIPQLGYSIAAWHGRSEPQSLSLHFDVGAYPQRLYPNEVRIEGLREGNHLVDAHLLKRVLLTIANCWDADWGVVEDWAYTGQTMDWNEKPLLPYGGWLTYLAHDLAQEVSPPPAVHAERIPDGGLLMLVSQEPLDVTNSVHVTRLDAVQQCLAPIQQSISSPRWWPEYYKNQNNGQ